MHDFPTVPNVFRVTSSQNIDSNNCSNANRKQQCLPKDQQHASLDNNLNHNNVATKTSLATTNNSDMCEQQQQQQQQQQQEKGGQQLNKQLQYNQVQQQHQATTMHKLTTTASIEHNYQQHGDQQHQYQHHQQYTPYATLPRTLNIATGRQHKNNNNFIVTSKSNNNNNATGVISTISGSIPATGYNADSLGSSFNDLRALNNLNNSYMNLNNLHTNNLHQHPKQHQQHQHQHQHQHQLQHQHQQQQYQQPRTAAAEQDQKHNKSNINIVTVRPSSISRFRTAHVSSESGIGIVPNSNGNENATGGAYLWLLTPVAASISVAIVIAALAGPQWLFTEEKLPNANYNGTANFNVLDDGAYITKYTKSSLWILCTTIQGVETYSCIKIDYFPTEGYQPDPHDSTLAIPYTVSKSCPIFLVSGLFLLISFIVFLIPTCSHQKNLYYFSAGILFIVSGLLMLIGLIAYISILKAEIGSKLRSRSTLQPALFKVTYGQSFFLFVFGFITTEFVGVLNIFLYINLQEVNYYNRLPCFYITNVKDETKKTQYPLSDSYKKYRQSSMVTAGTGTAVTAGRVTPTTTMSPMRKASSAAAASSSSSFSSIKTASVNGKTRLGLRHSFGLTGGNDVSGRFNQVHDIMAETEAKRWLQQHQRQLSQRQTLPGAFECRRHPSGSNLNLHNDAERRFYFEKPSLQSKCKLHSKSLAKSLSKLYTEPIGSSSSDLTIPPPPPPSVLRMTMPRSSEMALPPPLPQLYLHKRQPQMPPPQLVTADLPQEFPLKRSLSTATDIFSPETHTERKSHRNVATNTLPMTDHNGLEQRRNKRHPCGQHIPSSQRYSRRDEPQSQVRCDVNGSIDEDEDDDDYRQQRLCGLKRGMRKTKDELFQEFCKRAGMRPKPKNIYYVPSKDHQPEEFRRRRRHDNTMDTMTDYNNDGDGDDDDEYGFTQIRPEDDKNVFILNDKDHMVASRNQPALNVATQRRSSLFAEPIHMSKLNSNLPLHMLHKYSPDRVYHKSLLDLEHCDSQVELWSTDSVYPESQNTRGHGDFGGSQIRLQHEVSDHGTGRDAAGESYMKTLPHYLAQSRSLPRFFMRQSNNGMAALHDSLGSLKSNYSGGISMIGNHQQQLQENNRFLSLSRDTQAYNSMLALDKSCEDHSTTIYPAQSQSQLLEPQYTTQAANNNVFQQPPPPAMWPNAIPSSPSNYSSNCQLYPSLDSRPIHAQQPPSAAVSGTSGATATKFQRAYAFDDSQRRSSFAVTDHAFDLDNIERERRRSHASLFGNSGNTLSPNISMTKDQYDLINGTAV